MIKLIASDIDGTLIDSKHQLPEDFGYVLDKLNERGITFALSSGRSYNALARQFAEYDGKLSFISDNGAYVVHDGKAIGISPMKKYDCCVIAEYAQKLGILVLFCGMKGTYYCTKNDKFEEEINRYYNTCTRIDDISLCRDEILKLAVYNPNGIENDGYDKLILKFGNDFNVLLSGKNWCDIMNKDVSKGEGMKLLQQCVGADYNNSMAFGDYLNDVDMLENAYYSFAVENAHKLCKQAANFTTESNDHHPVTMEIRKLIPMD
ncbi:MAG: HAD family hydrolase [Oscillospiraceae bacterium]